MSIDRILIIRFSSLGDIILLTPLFRETRKRFPGSQIDFLTSTSFASVCRNNPNINNIIALDRKKGNRELNRVVEKIKQTDYDLILDGHQSLRSRLLLFKLFGIFGRLKKHIGLIDKRSIKRNILLLTKINLLKTAVSQREAYCQLLNPFCEDKLYDTSTELFPSKEDNNAVLDILHQSKTEGKTIIALGPSASFSGKCWPKEYFLELTNRFIERGFIVLLLGGPDDKEPNWIEENISKLVLNLAGKLSYLETAAILKYCSLSISNDSAIVHFAEAVKVPAFAIFGPTVKEFGYAPYRRNSRIFEIQLPCRPCSRNGKGDCKITLKRQCLKNISVESVWEQACRLLEKKRDYNDLTF
ncbi:glycosyltransferase family 9 protein [bacterium]|nr:glycosyltransferase family 9 protein [bacterium]